MRSYRLARRSFLQGVGAGAIGLRTMLRTMEASAQGMAPPPRFLLTHWPVGTIHYMWKPTGSGTTYTTSKILQPFEDAGLRQQMIAVYGMSVEASINGYTIPNGGGHEAGTVKVACGMGSPGTRNNGGEHDDAVAGGPSWDQIFLKRIPALGGTSLGSSGYAYALCDARVDSYETSTRCLNYSYSTDQTAGWGGNNGAAATLTEATPLAPKLSPLVLYNQLFSGFVPGGGGDAGGGGPSINNMVRLLMARKSVLDYALSQLTQLKMLAPASEAMKIDQHAQAIRAVENQLSTLIGASGDGGVAGGDGGAMACMAPTAPPASLTGKTADLLHDYSTNGQPIAQSTDDSGLHAQLGAAFFSIITAAFQCDLIRVATFQWSPGTNHVSFGNLFPNQPGKIYMHHPTSHLITSRNDTVGSLPAATMTQDIINFLANVHIWYNTQTAALINTLKNSTDVYGGNLLDYTIVPHISEVAECTHSWSPMMALIFGGAKLGMHGGQYVDLSANLPNYNDYWMSIAQAYVNSNTPLPTFAADTFIKTNVAPIPGLWG
jgi:Protein of unknown function (DUF1552)